MKLFFFDIDGTLLTEGKHRFVPDSTMTAIKRLQEEGHLCFINTGRSWSEVNENITTPKMDGFVCGCGTSISFHDKLLFHHEISSALCESIRKDLESNHIEWLLEGLHRIYYSNTPYTSRIGVFHDEYHKAFPDNCDDIDPASRGIVFDKICTCNTPKSSFLPFQKKYQEQFFFIDRGDGFHEIVPKPYSKATGIQYLMDFFHVSKQDTIAIGDSSNDLPMLDFAGLSIGMGAYDKAIGTHVDYITDTVENDGILHAMQHFHFI